MVYDVTEEATSRASADAALDTRLDAVEGGQVGQWRPSDNNLLAANFPPRTIDTGFNPPAGNYVLNRVRIPAGVTITNVHLYLTIAGAGLTYAAAAVYEADGTRVGLTGDQTAAWATFGHKSMALGAPIASQGSERWVWVAFASAGTTVPTFGIESIVVGPANVGLSAAPFSGGYIAGAAPLPASLTLSSMTTYIEFWVGIS